MTPRPEAAPAAIAAQALALRARPSRRQPRRAIQPGNQATSTPTTTDARRGHFKPSRRGQCKPSFPGGRTAAERALECPLARRRLTPRRPETALRARASGRASGVSIGGCCGSGGRGSASRWRRRERAVWTGWSGRPIWVAQRPRLCASAAITVQALFACVAAGGEVRQCLVFEVADHELDGGVVAVIDISDQGRDGAVGREAVVAPVGEQLGLRADQAGAAHDQPPGHRARSRRSAPRRSSG